MLILVCFYGQNYLIIVVYTVDLISVQSFTVQLIHRAYLRQWAA